MQAKEDSMTNVEMRGGILQDKAQTMETLSQTFHLKTSLTCSLEEATRQVSVTILCFHAKLVRYGIFIVILIMICLLTCATLM